MNIESRKELEMVGAAMRRLAMRLPEGADERGIALGLSEKAQAALAELPPEPEGRGRPRIEFAEEAMEEAFRRRFVDGEPISRIAEGMGLPRQTLARRLKDGGVVWCRKRGVGWKKGITKRRTRGRPRLEIPKPLAMEVVRRHCLQGETFAELGRELGISSYVVRRVVGESVRLKAGRDVG